MALRPTLADGLPLSRNPAVGESGDRPSRLHIQQTGVGALPANFPVVGNMGCGRAGVKPYLEKLGNFFPRARIQARADPPGAQSRSSRAVSPSPSPRAAESARGGVRPCAGRS